MEKPVYLFDLYGTLIRVHTDETLPAVWETMAARFAKAGAVCAPAELREKFEAAKAEAHRTLRARLGGRPEISYRKITLELIRKYGGNATEAYAADALWEFRKASNEYMELYPGVKALLETLRRAGYGLYVLSDAQTDLTRPELALLGLEPYFDGIYLSEEWGFLKPDRRFFDAVIEAAGLDRSRCVMVGNSVYNDIYGANNAGIRSFLAETDMVLYDSPVPAVPDFRAKGNDWNILGKALRAAADTLE